MSAFRYFATEPGFWQNQSGFDCIYKREFWRVSGKFWQIMASSEPAHPFTDTFTDSGQSCTRKPLLRKRLKR